MSRRGILLAPHMDVQVPWAQDAQERPPHTDMQAPWAQDVERRTGIPRTVPIYVYDVYIGLMVEKRSGHTLLTRAT